MNRKLFRPLMIVMIIATIASLALAACAPAAAPTCYNGRYKPTPTREGEQIGKNRPQFGSQAATRLREAGIASNGISERYREYVPGPKD